MTFADLAPLANHLWQSTLCVAVAWLLTLGMRKNRAAVRYGVWMAASVKFLIPFSLLVSAGAQLEWHAVPIIAPPRISAAIDEIAQPFAAQAAAPVAAVAAPALNPWLAILFAVWLGGIAIGIVFWLRCWWQVRSMRRAATPLEWNLPVKVMSSPTHREPGVFGIRKPCRLLPEGIADRLTPPQLEAILAHELRHVERRDNLTAAIHMLVETIFWFHPCVWWIRARLMEERERACDEEVVRMGSEPQVYAESILKVCEFYLTSPVPCAAGVTGGELKKRIEGIMANRKMRNLSAGKKLLVAAAGLITLSAPVALGVIGSPIGRARARVESYALAPSEGPVFVAAREAVVPAPVQAGPGAQKAPAGQTARALLLTSAVAGSPQTRKAPQAAPVFEVVSFKHAGNARNGQRMEGNTVFERAATRLGYNGVRLTGEEPLLFFIDFAYSPLLTPFQCEAPQWVTYNEEFYRIEAIAPPGTSIDGARAMLRTVLVERLGFQYHLVDRDTPIYALTRGSGELRLPRSTEAEPNPGYQQWGIFRNKSASLAQLAEFVSRIAGRTVVDRTGIQGLYRFDLDWSKQIENERQSGGSDPRNGGPGIAFAEVKQLGLKLEPGKELRKVLVVDHVNKEPTPN